MRAILRGALFVLLAICQAISGDPAFAAERRLPIVFVHGNGDTAALWITTFWRFESNGYPRELLYAIDLRYPQARSVNDQPQAGRSSAAEVMGQLSETVDRVRKKTGAERVVLVGQSRGGNTIRNYLKNGGGAKYVERVVLGGAVNHGVIISDQHLIGSEFNGASAFMKDLNSTPNEVVPGVRFMTIRSDNNDKFAQSDGRLIGLPNVATGLGHEAPELKGATNVVLAGVDHRETGYDPRAFAAMYRFITDSEPRTLDITRESQVELDGKISGFEAGAPTNIGIAGATVAVYRTSPPTGERLGSPVHRTTSGADGRWGPMKAEHDAYYEFVLEIPGYPVTHIYRSPFLRSSDLLHLRPQVLGKDDAAAGAVVYLSRPRGYFGAGRDAVLLGGLLPPGIPAGVPTVSSVKRTYPADTQHSVISKFNDEEITARTWPMHDNHVTVIELTY